MVELAYDLRVAVDRALSDDAELSVPHAGLSPVARDAALGTPARRRFDELVDGLERSRGRSRGNEHPRTGGEMTISRSSGSAVPDTVGTAAGVPPYEGVLPTARDRRIQATVDLADEESQNANNEILAGTSISRMRWAGCFTATPGSPRTPRSRHSLPG